ncbi:MAG: FtsX-like permease family protein [Bacteroidaceae bacterium]|nr:FtsX-like permease family protein [Bacteroidaceae bacterium]
MKVNLPLYIAQRYLFSKKSHNAINIISAISVCGVTLATLALVCTLSVFNGFHELVEKMFTNFDPDLKIEAAKGKTFVPTDSIYSLLQATPGIEVITETLEDNAMVQYKEKQAMATIKGVADNFSNLTSFDNTLLGNGQFIFSDDVADYGIMGIQLVYTLNCGFSFVDPLEVYAPKRGTRVNMANPMMNFTKKNLYNPGLVFRVNQEEYDGSYIITSLDFARSLYGYDNEVSALELKVSPSARVKKVKKALRSALGDAFTVKDRYEQQEEVFKIVEIEKFISYLFLCFILLIACFNIISSVSMLILDKEKNMTTLRSLGAGDELVRHIFIWEGHLITLCGAAVGLVLGVLLCLAQQHFGIVKLGSAGSFVVDAYPVSVHLSDIVLVFVTVFVVSGLSVWLPVRMLARRLTHSNEGEEEKG